MWTYLMNVPPLVLAIAAICTVVGTMFLSFYIGLGGFLNALACLVLLFAGGIAANWLATQIEVPIQDATEKAIFASFAGILVSSLIAVIVLPRNT